MHEEFQKTIKEIVTFNGIGLHSGQKSRITIYPGKNDQGIIFKRTDLKENNLIKASLLYMMRMLNMPIRISLHVILNDFKGNARSCFNSK